MPTGVYPRPERLCTFPGCGGKHYARDWCEGHYQQPDPKQPLRVRDFDARFWARVHRSEPDACWPWSGPPDKGGYGSVHAGGLTRRKMERTHRIAWILTNGPIPRRLHVLHTCDNRICCNPGHLYLGTNTDNVADRVRRGRSKGGKTWGKD